jgi:hypothetical protein
MPTFISATTHHVRSEPCAHSSHAQYRHAIAIPAISTIADAPVASIAMNPCRTAEDAASTAHVRRPRTADVAVKDIGQSSQQWDFGAAGTFNAGLRSKNPTGLSLNPA